MKIKRDEDGIYKIEGTKYVRIIRSYFSDTQSCYELVVRSISPNKWNDRIFYTYKLKTLKEFLAQYENEKDLLFDYYTARLDGKTRLDFFGNKIFRV